MAEDPGAGSARAVDEGRGDGRAVSRDPQQLRADIERTRQELGDTVAALVEKTDVKARAREKVAEVRGNVTRKRTEVTDRARQSSPDGAGAAIAQAQALAEQHPVIVAAVAAFAGGLLLGRLGRRS
jgi:ElaB/YqjD/DUF883 family membrane-anchored ribosome-binding protein